MKERNEHGPPEYEEAAMAAPPKLSHSLSSDKRNPKTSKREPNQLSQNKRVAMTTQKR
eukprot:UN04207